MAQQIQIRRGTNAAFTGAEGELQYRTDLDTLAVHDGSTPGGAVLATRDYSDAAILTASQVRNLLFSFIGGL